MSLPRPARPTIPPAGWNSGLRPTGAGTCDGRGDARQVGGAAYGAGSAALGNILLPAAMLQGKLSAVNRGPPRIAAEGVVGKDGKEAHRVSVTLTLTQHAELKRIAKKYRVKVSWLVRRAAEQLIEQEQGGPLLPLDLEGTHAKR